MCLGVAEVEVHCHGMANVEVPVGFWWEPSDHLETNSAAQRLCIGILLPRRDMPPF